MKVSKGQSQPEIAAAAFLILHMVLGRPFLYRVLIMTFMTHLSLTVVLGCQPAIVLIGFFSLLLFLGLRLGDESHSVL